MKNLLYLLIILTTSCSVFQSERKANIVTVDMGIIRSINIIKGEKERVDGFHTIKETELFTEIRLENNRIVVVRGTPYLEIGKMLKGRNWIPTKPEYEYIGGIDGIYDLNNSLYGICH